MRRSRCGQAPTGRQWFPLIIREPNERWDGANKAAPGLERFLDTELARRKLPPSALALVGFSQGTMMALHVGLRRAAPPAAIVGYSGIFVLPDKTKAEAIAAEIKSKPPVLLIHGDQDDLIPVQALLQARAGPGRAWSARRVAHFGGCRPRHRPGRPAPRRRRSSPADSGCAPDEARARRMIRSQPAHFARFTIPSPTL